MKTLLFRILFFCLIVCRSTAGSRILIAAPHGTKSHHNVFVPLTKELVRRGHDVTFISNYVSEELNGNCRQITIDKLAIDTSRFPNPFEAMKTISASIGIVIEFLKIFVTYPSTIAETFYGDDRVQRLLKTEQFDVVMISETCRLPCYPLGWHFKAPVITISPNVLFLGRARSLGDQEHLSYVPFILSSFTNRMTLYQRTLNVAIAGTFLFVSRDLNVNPVHSIVKNWSIPIARLYLNWRGISLWCSPTVIRVSVIREFYHPKLSKWVDNISVLLTHFRKNWGDLYRNRKSDSSCSVLAAL